MQKNMLAVLALLSTVAGAQSTAPPAPAANAPVISPEVMADGRVTFRLRAPQATEVTMAGDFWVDQNRVEKLTKGSDGVWSLTTEPLPPDLYSYFFTVNGVTIPDPVNGQLKQGIRTQQSMFTIPGADEQIYEPAAVPHGDVRVVTYQANSLGKTRRMHVYFPPGYDKGSTRYPVTYLFHGGGDDDWAWLSIGRVNHVLDNLIAQGKAKPMVVVMPSLWAVDAPVPANRADENEVLFRKSVFEDIVPYVESHYRVLTGPANRAFGGLGAGRNALPNFLWASLDKLNSAFFVSGGADKARIAVMEKQYPGVLARPENSKRIKFFMCDGSNDASITSSRDLTAELKRLSYNVTTFETEGTHGWPSFRRCFVEFAKIAFR